MLQTRSRVEVPFSQQSVRGPLPRSFPREFDGSDYSWEISDSIRDVDLDAWLQLCPHRTDPFMNPRLLGAVETAMAAQAKVWYVLIRDGEERPVAAATISCYELDATVLAVGASAKIAKLVAKVIPALTRIKILFLGMPFSAGQSHVRLAPQADQPVIVKLLSELLEQKARETKAEMIVAKELEESELAWASLLEDYGYRRADSLPMNYMSTQYNSFDDYLAVLRSKKRNELKGIMKRFGNTGLELRVLRGEEAAQHYTDRAHQLYESVLLRSENQAEHLPREFFLEFARQLPDDAKFLYIYDREDLVAFGCCIDSDEIFAPIFCGFDFEKNRELGLYFNLLFLSVDEGLRGPGRQLWVGATADELKNNKLGTYQEPRYLYVRGGWWLARFVLRFAFNLFFPSHELHYPREPLLEAKRAA